MKFSFQDILNLQWKADLAGAASRRAFLIRPLASLQGKAAQIINLRHVETLYGDALIALERLKSLGCTNDLEDYERRKLRVFNVLNFLQLIFGIIIPLTALAGTHRLTGPGWVAACMPALVSLLVLWLNSRRNYEAGTLCYFILYPVMTSIVYLSGMNLGIELFFILYGILAVFFIQDIGHMLFTITLSMLSYFILTVVWRNYQFQLEVNGMLYLFNHLIAIIFIFFGLYLLKRENADYQLSILNHNRLLYEKNIEIEKQRQEIALSAALLHVQAGELRDLNALKNKLFSVIAHDLKSPLYALRTLFINIERYHVPAEEVRAMVPEVVKDLSVTTMIMENLLNWAKTQMQTLEVHFDTVDAAALAEEAIELGRRQAHAKQIKLINDIEAGQPVLAQEDMIRMVIRNLVSNAIKFTPRKGTVRIGAVDRGECLELYVQDSGVGMSREALEKIAIDDYYSTKGTSRETGNGLGLILCKEFILKNNSALQIDSEEGKGSRLSFRLKKANA